MIDTTQLTQLISAFRVETEKESISPETVGSLLQNITDLLANASSTTEQQIFENWKAILSQLNLVEDIGISVEGVESVNIAISLRDLANGGHSARLFNIPSATPLRAGVMTAQQANTLMTLDAAVGALELAVVNIGNKNAEQDNRLDIIQGRSDVITAISQGSDHTSKVYLTIRKENLKTGAIYNKINNKEIAAATSEKAGVMTAQQAKDLQKAVNGLLVQDELIRVLHSIDLVVTSIENRPYRKDCLYYGVEYCDLYAGERFPADDDIMIPGATIEHAGVMTAKQVQRLDDAERDIYNLKNAPSGAASKSMFPISVAIEEDSTGMHLRVLGAKPLLDRGYSPFLFRLSKKRNYIPHDEKHALVHKGWHRVGQGTDTLHISDSGRASISITALKHADIDIDAEEENYREEAEWFVNDREKNGLHVASYGNRIIKIQYLTGHEVKSHKVRLLYGIAFSKQKPSPREKFDMSQLVTDIATFHVSTVPYNHGSEYRWVFER